MVNRKTLGLVTILVTGALITYFMEPKGKHQETDPRIGQGVLPSEDILKISSITLTKDGTHLTLKQDAEKRWLIQGPETFPAAAGKVVDYLEEIRDVKIRRSIGNGSEILSSLEISDKASIKLQGEGVDIQLLLGKNRSGGGQFIGFTGSETGYLMGQSLELDTEAANWEYKTLINLKAEQVKAVKLPDNKQLLEFNRENKDADFSLKGLAEKETLKTTEANRLKSLLSNVSFNAKAKRQEAYDKQLASTSPVVIQSFDGQEYKIKIVQLEVTETTQNAEGKDETHTTDHYYFHIDSADPKLKDVRVLMETWQFEISEYTANNFLKTRRDFVEKSQS